jgi:hypothetical protein
MLSAHIVTESEETNGSGALSVTCDVMKMLSAHIVTESEQTNGSGALSVTCDVMKTANLVENCDRVHLLAIFAYMTKLRIFLLLYFMFLIRKLFSTSTCRILCI